MGIQIIDIFSPITAYPSGNNSIYIELPPSEALKPYIKCFWGTLGNISINNPIKSRVIPDICMDIIINFDLTSNNFSDLFCGINNKPFISYGNFERENNFTFAIRFYSWSVILFVNESLRYALNDFSSSEKYFSDFIHEIKSKLMYSKNIYERKLISEEALLRRINTNKENSVIQNGMYCILKKHANVSVSELASYCCVSKRHLERIFSENTAVSPKQMIELIRYQQLWQSSLKSNFNIPNAIEQFGFYDQSHLLREFKKYHGLPLSEAKKEAIKMSHFYNTK